MAKGPATVDFFDDDEPESRPSRGSRSVPPPRGGGSHGAHVSPPANRQQARVRQIAFLAGAIIFLILIVIAFRGCLDARKSRSYENYVSDLSSITAETKQLSDGFFGQLSGNPNAAEQDIGLQNQVNGNISTSQSLLDRAKGLDAPGELGAAQAQIVLSYTLRHDALAGIATQLDRTGGANAKQATDAIYTQMKVLSASDILYARARDQIEQALTDQGVTVDNGVPESQFLPKTPNYLIPSETEQAISGAASSTGSTSNASCQKDGKTHGLGLVDGGTTLQPSGTVLPNGGTVTAPGGDDSIEVSVQNQGEVDESNVDVTVSGTGIKGSDTISTIAAGETQTATVPITAPPAGKSVDVTVEVATVPCEQVAENNTQTTTATF